MKYLHPLFEMGIKDMKRFQLGREYWHEYVRVNGYAFRPSRDGLRKLSKILGLPQKHVAEHIEFFLSA
jgi:hypothetical protein